MRWRKPCYTTFPKFGECWNPHCTTKLKIEFCVPTNRKLKSEPSQRERFLKIECSYRKGVTKRYSPRGSWNATPYVLCNETLRFRSCAESANLRSRIGAEKPKLDSRAEDLWHRMWSSQSEPHIKILAGQQSPNLGSAQTLTGQQNPDLDSAHSQSRQEKSWSHCYA